MRTTHLIIALNVLVFVAMQAVTGGQELSRFSTETLLRFGALYAPLVRAEDQWFRLVTATFIHLDVIHLLMNMLALRVAGQLLEEHLGKGRFVALYLFAGVVGAAVGLAWHFGTETVAAGASGAISGLLGAAAIAGHMIGTAQGKVVRNEMIRWIVLTYIYGLFVNVDHAQHTGGLAGGLLLGWLFEVALRRRPAHRESNGPGLEAVVLVAVFGASFAWGARDQDRAMSAPMLVNRGVELSKQGKTDEAIELYRRAIKLAPKEPIAHFDLALSLIAKNDIDGAMKSLETAHRLAPTDSRIRELYEQLRAETSDKPR